MRTRILLAGLATAAMFLVNNNIGSAKYAANGIDEKTTNQEQQEIFNKIDKAKFPWVDLPKFERSVIETIKLAKQSPGTQSDKNSTETSDMTRELTEQIIALIGKGLTVNQAIDKVKESLNNAVLYVEAVASSGYFKEDSETKTEPEENEKQSASEDLNDSSSGNPETQPEYFNANQEPKPEQSQDDENSGTQEETIEQQPANENLDDSSSTNLEEQPEDFKKPQEQEPDQLQVTENTETQGETTEPQPVSENLNNSSSENLDTQQEDLPPNQEQKPEQSQDDENTGTQGETTEQQPASEDLNDNASLNPELQVQQETQNQFQTPENTENQQQDKIVDGAKNIEEFFGGNADVSQLLAAMPAKYETEVKVEEKAKKAIPNLLEDQRKDGNTPIIINWWEDDEDNGQMQEYVPDVEKSLKDHIREGYKNWCLYSPDLTIGSNSSVDLISSRTVTDQNFSEGEVEYLIKMQYFIALATGHNVLIIPMEGFKVSTNNARTIANLYKKLLEDPMFKGKIKYIIFVK